MRLILVRPDNPNDLTKFYDHAFSNAVELAIVSAYLTEWNVTTKLNNTCKRLRIIVGTDFGITRKAACTNLLKWLPRRLKSNAYFADSINGFHPKAVFWKEKDGTAHAILGSSNLKNASFNRNFEANAYEKLSGTEYRIAIEWLDFIEKNSAPLTEDLLKKYEEAKLGRKPRNGRLGQTAPQIVDMKIVELPGVKQLLTERRRTLANYLKIRPKLDKLFRDCAAGSIDNDTFFRKLPSYWGREPNTRLQGSGWERRGKEADFKQLARAYVRIIEASDLDRDDVVVEELDRLVDSANPARGAFFSEMLCLRFPELYPILNSPVWRYLQDIKFRSAVGSSDGSKYLDLARKLRYALRQNPTLSARNLAELDCVIWQKYQ